MSKRKMINLVKIPVYNNLFFPFIPTYNRLKKKYKKIKARISSFFYFHFLVAKYIPDNSPKPNQISTEAIK